MRMIWFYCNITSRLFSLTVRCYQESAVGFLELYQNHQIRGDGSAQLKWQSRRENEKEEGHMRHVFGINFVPQLEHSPTSIFADRFYTFHMPRTHAFCQPAIVAKIVVAAVGGHTYKSK